MNKLSYIQIIFLSIYWCIKNSNETPYWYQSATCTHFDCLDCCCHAIAMLNLGVPQGPHFPSELFHHGSAAVAERLSAERLHAERMALSADPLVRLQMASLGLPTPPVGGMNPGAHTHTHSHSHTHLHLHPGETNAGVPPPPPSPFHPLGGPPHSLLNPFGPGKKSEKFISIDVNHFHCRYSA